MGRPGLHIQGASRFRALSPGYSPHFPPPLQVNPGVIWSSFRSSVGLPTGSRLTQMSMKIIHILKNDVGCLVYLPLDHVFLLMPISRVYVQFPSSKSCTFLIYLIPIYSASAAAVNRIVFLRISARI